VAKNIYKISLYWEESHVYLLKKHFNPIYISARYVLQFAFTYKRNIHEILLKKIKLCHKLRVKGKGTRWHSPYLSFVQSSGFGKSRACKEIAMSIVGEKWFAAQNGLAIEVTSFSATILVAFSLLTLALPRPELRTSERYGECQRVRLSLTHNLLILFINISRTFPLYVSEGIAKCFCATLIKNPSSPFDTSKPVPAIAGLYPMSTIKTRWLEFCSGLIHSISTTVVLDIVSKMCQAWI
jgi:hypothetical protein